jgi:hypothetical protein
MLSYSDKEEILSRFPNIKLSYENIVYKKVYNADMNLAIPEGVKCFAWFTTVNDKNVCLIMELTENKQIKDIKINNACFSNELSYGTILYGTVFYHLNNKFFCIEDIFSFKGTDIERENWGSKLFILKDILKNHIKQVSYNNSFMVFGLPIITNNTSDMIKCLENIKYKISFIQFRSFNRTNNYLFMNYNGFKDSPVVEKQKEVNTNANAINVTNATNATNATNVNVNKNRVTMKREVVLIVKPDIQNDIYHLYCLNNLGDEEYIGIACISNYDVSVMMNTHFRKIKENKNLDALEESDDEEEFEDEKEDKFVYLDRSLKMVCKYNYKFKKWSPIKIADASYKVAFKKDLPIMEKK